MDLEVKETRVCSCVGSDNHVMEHDPFIQRLEDCGISISIQMEFNDTIGPRIW